MMFIERIETVIPCFSDPWKLRIIAHLNCPPDLKELAETLEARYSESLGVVMVRLGKRTRNGCPETVAQRAIDIVMGRYN